MLAVLRKRLTQPKVIQPVVARNVLMRVQVLVLLPFIGKLPTWLIAIGMATILLQLSQVKAKLRLAGRFEHAVQVLLFFGSLAGIFFTYRTLLGVEAGIAFLVLCLIAKMLEVHARRDAYIVLTLALFVISAGFLFGQDLSATLWALLGLVGVLYAMIAQNDDGTGRSRTLMLLMLQAVPLMVVLFVFFPRFPPLWSVNLGAGQAKTGMSDEMSPGDIASLSQSTDLAFRVFFAKGQRPEKSNLYWRGLVFSQFDGQKWRPYTDHRLSETTAWAGEGAPDWLETGLFVPEQIPINYRVSMEATQQPWLFALNFSYAARGAAFGLTRDYTLHARWPLTERQQIEFVQYPKVVLDTQLPDWLRQVNVMIPQNGNPKSQQFARLLFDQTGRDPQRYADAVLRWIQQQNFAYTLQPPRLAGNRIDQFLFESRRGFCEHYSSAFTFLMRSVGIPARVVVGYQGGQLGRDGQSWEVRQMDAHAWSEIWLPEQGWVRVDPTAAIAPERIERGMQEIVQSSADLFGEGAAAQLRKSQFQLMGQLRSVIDYASYLWQRDVVGFDQAKQANQLLKWFGMQSLSAQLLTMFAAVMTLVGLIVAVLWYRRRKIWHPVDQPIISLSRRMQVVGLNRQPAEGVLDWLRRLGRESHQVERATYLANLYQEARYWQQDGSTEQHRLLIQIRTLVKKWPRIEQKKEICRK